MSEVLSQSLKIPENPQIVRILEDAQSIAESFLDKHYSEKLISDYQQWQEENKTKNYKFLSQSEKYNPFQNEDSYYYNRFKRCTYQLITKQLNTHTDKHKAFQLIKNNPDSTKKELKEKLFEQEDYINYHSLKQIYKEQEKYQKTHGETPDSYTSLNNHWKTPHHLPLSPDDNHIHSLEQQGDKLILSIKTPTCNKPTSYHDYGEIQAEISIPPHLRKLLDEGELKKPSLRLSNGKILLDIPVKVNSIKSKTITDRVMAW